MRVSVIIPVYNEKETIVELLRRVQSCGTPLHEILVVDDGSDDGTYDQVAGVMGDGSVRVFRHRQNLGKGAAVATGLKHATGDVVAIQDADLEYDPADLPALVAPIAEDRADVVFGSRVVDGHMRNVAYPRQRWANRLLTACSNLLAGLRLTDMECGSKAFRRELLRGIQIEETGFAFEPEITAKVAKRNPRVAEVKVSYRGRTVAEGKKVSWTDGLRALYVIVKYNWVR